MTALVMPYVLRIGGVALSVEMPTTTGILRSIATLATFCEPSTFTSMHSSGYFSPRSTYLVAAACTRMSGRVSITASRIDS